MLTGHYRMCNVICGAAQSIESQMTMLIMPMRSQSRYAPKFQALRRQEIICLLADVTANVRDVLRLVLNRLRTSGVGLLRMRERDSNPREYLPYHRRLVCAINRV